MFIFLRDDELILFSGGMPRSSYGDRHTITASTATKHVVFDLTSKVIDFFTIMPKPEEDSEKENEKEKQSAGPEALVILAEEEIVAIDLTDPDWKMMALPYLVSLHASAVSLHYNPIIYILFLFRSPYNITIRRIGS